MKKIILTFLAIISIQANAVEWIPIADDESIKQLIDRSSIQRRGDIVYFWTMKNFKNIQYIGKYKYMSIKQLKKINCKTKQLAFDYAYFLSKKDGEGDLVYTAEPENIYTPIPPESVAELQYTIACVIYKK